MRTFLFLFTILLPSLLVGQEVSSAPKTEVSAQSEASSSLQPAPLSPAANSSTNSETLPPGEPNVLPSNTSSTSSSATDTAAPIDPSAEAPQGGAPSNAPAAPEKSSAGEIGGPTSEQTEEPLKASTEKPLESTEKNGEQIKIRYYQVRAQVERDPEVAAIKQEANTAVSEEKKRQALRAYYELLFKKMKSIDASINNRCDIMQAAYLRRLEQVSLEPTIPLTPLESPSSTVKKKEVTSVEAVPAAGSSTSKKKKHHS